MARDADNTINDHALWRFSLAVYGAHGVKEECLALQDTHDIDVNLLLFAAWTGAARGVRLDATTLSDARAAVAAWSRNVIGSLRAARRATKRLAGAGPLYGAIMDVELAAERAAQDMLFALGARIPQPDPMLVMREELTRSNIRLLIGEAAPFPEALLRSACRPPRHDSQIEMERPS
jgi:uncharacterized protein (TIGR02444 family)